ncbi:hypothetical protein Tco_0064597 [Tanacetum coccineum]
MCEDEAVHKELGDSLVRAATTSYSLEVEQDSDDADIGYVNDRGTLTGDEVFAEQEVTAKDVNLTIDEVTLAQALAALKSVKPKVIENVIEEPNVPVNAVSASTKDKGKGIMVEEPVKTMKKKDLIRLDEEIASKLQAEFDEEERLAREKAKKDKEANVALIEEWDDIQTKIEVDHELAQRLQAEEQKELSVEERQNYFNNSWSKEESTLMLKNMEGKKPKDLKNKSFDSIQKMFDRAFKRVNTFVDFKTELVEGSSKRVGEELKQESTKKVFSQLLKSVDREDLVELYKLVKAKYGSTRPVEDMDLLLWARYGLYICSQGTREPSRMVSSQNFCKSRFCGMMIWERCDHNRNGGCCLLSKSLKDLHAGRKEISSYTTYNYRYAKQEASG